MRYLKVFENFDLGFSEISFGSRGPVSKGVEKFTNNNSEEFTDLEIKQIKIFLKKYEIDETNLKIIPGSGGSIAVLLPYKDTMCEKSILVEKFKDEWFLVTDYPFFYECDQIYGVINFFKKVLSKKIKESFRDDSGFDLDKSLEIDNYWKGYLNKMKADQDKLKKELEEDTHYFNLVEEDDLDYLFDKIVDFEDGEIEKIKVLFTDKYLVREGKWKKYNGNNAVSFMEAIRSNFCLIRIWKLEDEWYLVSTSDVDNRGGVFDKCDQFDGLKRLLDKTLIK